jgi:hypothetical protein
MAAKHGASLVDQTTGDDVLLIHLLEANDVTLPGKSTLVRRILDDRTAATSGPSGRGAAPPARLSITMREVAFSRRRADARMIGPWQEIVARRTRADLRRRHLATATPRR